MVLDGQVGGLLTVREVARLLHVHPNTLRHWSDKGVIKSHRINQRGDRRFMWEEVARFLRTTFSDEAELSPTTGE